MDSLTSKSSIVQSVVVAYELLNFLAKKGRPQRVTDIAINLNMTKARVSRHLSTLAALQLVVKAPDNRGYRLGSKLFSLSNAAMAQYEITNITDRYLIALKNKILKPLFLSIPAGGDAVVASTLILRFLGVLDIQSPSHQQPEQLWLFLLQRLERELSLDEQRKRHWMGSSPINFVES